MKVPRTISLDEELWTAADAAVASGEAASVSAYIAAAVSKVAHRKTTLEVLAEFDEELGPPGPDVVAWVERVNAGLEYYQYEWPLPPRQTPGDPGDE